MVARSVADSALRCWTATPWHADFS